MARAWESRIPVLVQSLGIRRMRCREAEGVMGTARIGVAEGAGEREVSSWQCGVKACASRGMKPRGALRGGAGCGLGSGNRPEGGA
jgi:hypothetical protein